VKERRTRQLEAIYEAVRTAVDHPSADEVYARVRQQLPSVSLGTVYRNLQKLSAQGRVRVLHLKERVARYDALVHEHDHFVCERCDAVADVARPAGQPTECPALAQSGYAVHAQTLTFYGVCPRCQRAAPLSERRDNAGLTGVERVAP
jgi:Fe2+ or Zn2+ uptake regulation protein